MKKKFINIQTNMLQVSKVKIQKILGLFILFLIIVNLLQIGEVQAVMKNNNPLLRDIKINGQDIKPQFDQFITDYVFAIDENKVEIEAITDDPNAKAEIIGDTNLKTGVNNFEIKVTAEDGKTTNSYYLHITKGNQEKANANLKSLEVKGIKLNPEFNDKDINYLVEYEGYIESLDITAIPENENAKVEILDNNNFVSTLHVVTIKVTAEDKITTKEYKLTVKKAGESVEDPSGIEEHEEDIEQAKQEMQKQNYIDSSIVLGGIILLILLVIVVLIVMAKKGKKKI